MNKIYTAAGIGWRIWLLTSAILTIGISSFLFLNEPGDMLIGTGIALIASIVGSIPAFIALFICIYLLKNLQINWRIKFYRLLFVQFAVTIGYGLFAAVIDIPLRMSEYPFISTIFFVTAILFACSGAASFILLKAIAASFSELETAGLAYYQVFNSLFYNTSKNKFTMETTDHGQQSLPLQQNQSNRLLIKGIITGVLILLMLIPTIFINNIILEREQRQKEVVKEVSNKWASAQTISGPYLAVPYSDTSVNNEGKTIVVKKQLVLLANNLDIDGKIIPEERPRSIYKVLLYKSELKISGSFKPRWPLDLNTANIDFANARLCFGISDFKGIEEEIHINFNHQDFSLSPGLPVTLLDEIGLSVPVSISLETINSGIPFNMQVRLKGSEQLHFMPLAANCKFTLGSLWPSPSFDGNSLPNEREVTEKGFTAKWNFNQANLPFGTVIRESVQHSNLAFGVSMVQPADHYDKTMRCIKYAILIIGLTFALFFIIEIMQRKPFHPVQYVLIGLALVIFYTLLLSISEYLFFDQAYLVASAATVLLISLYAHSHFKSGKTALVFGSALGLLYSFIFVLIRLEDTALLVGSIGLFLVLALVMYASRKVNWYGTVNNK